MHIEFIEQVRLSSGDLVSFNRGGLLKELMFGVENEMLLGQEQ